MYVRYGPMDVKRPHWAMNSTSKFAGSLVTFHSNSALLGAGNVFRIIAGTPINADAILQETNRYLIIYYNYYSATSVLFVEVLRVEEFDKIFIL